MKQNEWKLFSDEEYPHWLAKDVMQGYSLVECLDPVTNEILEFKVSDGYTFYVEYAKPNNITKWRYKETPMLNTIKIVVGDWSQDGHNNTEDFYIKTNVAVDVLQDIFTENSKKLEFNLRSYCTDYEDNEIPTEDLMSVLNKLSVNIEELELDDFYDDDEEDEEEKYYFNPESWFKLFCHICKYEQPTLIIEHVSVLYANTIEIGGYGLFSN